MLKMKYNHLGPGVQTLVKPPLLLDPYSRRFGADGEARFEDEGADHDKDDGAEMAWTRDFVVEQSVGDGGAVELLDLKLSHDGDDNRSCRGRVRCCWLEHELNHHHEPGLRRRRRSWSSRFRPETDMMISGGVRGG
ncbi:hypothetical protein F2Q70_00008506 [Brassica cretica]|uniref:Uncharacterized protein n=1 Tax=Brassica cretica TaxID=69181 RepID=A0A8S9LXA0_BRACR|nr:hypothetical protein F2Q70_00008506 [Brassica cretica]